MILIIASNLDVQAKAFTEMWEPNEAVSLSVNDLTTPGWRISLDNFNSSVFVADGELLAVKEITGLINLLPMVSEIELFKIVPEDRSYVASELNALLLFLLSELKCPMLNLPSINNLCGQSDRIEQWLQAHFPEYLPAVSLSSDIANLAGHRTGELKCVSFLGGNSWGDNTILSKKSIESLSIETGLNFFSIYFSEEAGGCQYVSSSTRPDYSDKITLSHLKKFFNKHDTTLGYNR